MPGVLRKRCGRPMLPEVRSRVPPSTCRPPTITPESNTCAKIGGVVSYERAPKRCPNGGTDWDRTGWSWAGHRAPARQPCAPREPPDTAPTCASSARRKSSFRPIRGHRSPGCNGRRDRRKSRRGPTRGRGERTGRIADAATRPDPEHLASLKSWCELRKRHAPPVVSTGDSTTIKPGDQAKVSTRGTFVFTVNDIDEDTGIARIEVDADSPLTYPWPARLTDLVGRRGLTPKVPSSCRSLSLHLFGGRYALPLR